MAHGWRFCLWSFELVWNPNNGFFWSLVWNSSSWKGFDWSLPSESSSSSSIDIESSHSLEWCLIWFIALLFKSLCLTHSSLIINHSFKSFYLISEGKMLAGEIRICVIKTQGPSYARSFRFIPYDNTLQCPYHRHIKLQGNWFVTYNWLSFNYFKPIILLMVNGHLHLLRNMLSSLSSKGFSTIRTKCTWNLTWNI